MGDEWHLRAEPFDGHEREGRKTTTKAVVKSPSWMQGTLSFMKKGVCSLDDGFIVFKNGTMKNDIEACRVGIEDELVVEYVISSDGVHYIQVKKHNIDSSQRTLVKIIDW